MRVRITKDMSEPEACGMYLLDPGTMSVVVVTHIRFGNISYWVGHDFSGVRIRWTWTSLKARFADHGIARVDSDYTEPTDDEIEMAAFGIFKETVNMGKLHPVEYDYWEAFRRTPDMVLDSYRRQAKSALAEARKAVTA